MKPTTEERGEAEFVKFKHQCEEFGPGSVARLRPTPKEIEPKSYVGICQKHCQTFVCL